MDILGGLLQGFQVALTPGNLGMCVLGVVMGKPTPQIRAVVAPPAMPADAAAYWEGRFARLRETAFWKKYVADNQLEDAYLPGAELKKSMADIEGQLKEQFVQAGVKVVR